MKAAWTLKTNEADYCRAADLQRGSSPQCRWLLNGSLGQLSAFPYRLSRVHISSSGIHASAQGCDRWTRPASRSVRVMCVAPDGGRLCVTICATRLRWPGDIRFAASMKMLIWRGVYEPAPLRVRRWWWRSRQKAGAHPLATIGPRLR